MEYFAVFAGIFKIFPSQPQHGIFRYLCGKFTRSLQGNYKALALALLKMYIMFSDKINLNTILPKICTASLLKTYNQ